MITLKKVQEALNTFTNTKELTNHFPSSDPQIAGEYGYGESPTEHRPTQEFWAMWNENKETLKSLGIQVWKDEGYGDWWVSLPTVTETDETETVTETDETETVTETDETEFVGEKDGIKVVKRDEDPGMGRSTITYFFFIHPDGREEEIGSTAVASVKKRVENFLS